LGGWVLAEGEERSVVGKAIVSGFRTGYIGEVGYRRRESQLEEEADCGRGKPDGNRARRLRQELQETAGEDGVGEEQRSTGKRHE
jgi:hypothetical protein